VRKLDAAGQNETLFIYSAYAQSIGGVLSKPLTTFLTDGPSASLPVIGGLVAHEKEDVRFKIGSAEVLRVGRAAASVSGQTSTQGFLSVATATVEKLNILDVVTADRVVAKVTSLYSGRSSKFFISGSHFENLRIDGKPFECDYRCEETNSFDAVLSARELVVSRPWKCKFSDCEGKENDSCQIYVEQFGTIHLGEKIIYGDKVILSMIRIEFGCPYDGSVAVANASTNGKNGL